MGAIITEYRDVEKEFGDWSGGWGDWEWAGYPHGYAIKEYRWKQRGVYTVGGVYANTMTTEEVRWFYLGRRNGDKPFDNGDDIFKDGVFDFIACRQRIEVFNNGWALSAKLFERQYIYPGFVEILVMNFDENMGHYDAAGVHS